MNIWNATSKRSLEDSIYKVLNVNKEQLSVICSQKKTNCEYFHEKFSNITGINLSLVEIDEIVLHHVTNTLNIESIKTDGLKPLNELLQYRSCLNNFLKENSIELNFMDKKIKFMNSHIDLNVNLRTRIFGDTNINCFLFKEDILGSNNRYINDGKGILDKGPELIVEIDKEIDKDLLYEWNNLRPKKYIVSIQVPLQAVELTNNVKHLISDSIEWYCNGYAEKGNYYTILNNFLVESKHILNIVEII